jgi:Holliday junction resolvase RusA-like endonuclease
VHSGLKPLSANDSFTGRKVKTSQYRKYETHLKRTLPDLVIPDGLLEVRLVVYYSNKNSDLDNAVKPFLDCLCKRYGFDDRYVYRIVLTKFIVPKDQESIAFRILPHENLPYENLQL